MGIGHWALGMGHWSMGGWRRNLSLLCPHTPHTSPSPHLVTGQVIFYC
ncbi:MULTISPECIES: hypothetical protein [Nostoc]|nr:MULTISPECIES: hypothetical protein [Nostoc]